MGKRNVYFHDLPRIVSGGFKQARGIGEGWVSFKYATENAKGAGIMTGYASKAVELSFDVGLKGLHEIYVALGMYSSCRVRVDGEKGFREIITQHGGASFQECYVGVYEMSGKKLYISPAYCLDTKEGSVAYIKAVPVDSKYRGERNLITTNDGFSWIAVEGMESIKDIYKVFAPYKESDFFRVHWGIEGADNTGHYYTKAGTIIPFETTHAYRQCDRVFSQTIKRLLESGENLLTTAVDAAKDAGVEIHFYIRPEAFHCPFPYEWVFDSFFWKDNPQWRCRDEFGNPVNRMSYAYSEVQNHMIDMIEELLGYNPDGISFAFNRSLPLMICEQPVIDEFKRRTGRTPQLPDEVDSPQMVGVRHAILNSFVEKLSGLLKSRGKNLSFMTEEDGKHNKLMGLDLETITENGWIESVCVCGTALNSDYWKKILNTGKTKIYPSPIYSWTDIYNMDKILPKMREILDSGFHGGFIWDSDRWFENPYNWFWMRRMGRKENIDRLLNGKDNPVFEKIIEINGDRYDRYNPMMSY